MNFLFLEIDQSKINGDLVQPIQGPFFITNHKSKFQQFKVLSNWNTSEKIKFAVFFYKNSINFNKMDKKLTWQILGNLSKFVKTRNLCQCKSFYSKIQKDYGTIHEFIQRLKDQIEDFSTQFELYLKKYEQFFAKTSNNNTNSLEEQICKQNVVFDSSHLAPIIPIPQKNQSKNFTQKTRKLSSLPEKTLKAFYPQFKKKMEAQERLQECHQLFIQWLEKVSQIFEQK